MEKEKHSVWKIVFAIAIILIICFLGYICWFLYNVYSSGTEYEKIKPTEATEATLATLATESATYGDTPDAPLDNIAPEEVHDTVNGEINYTELWEINTDLYAWI
ncbi:MAG: hypothetical protein II233_06890, partial [Clostridia bacterium]|nr:hypothetical protein [Clostridia bacterium]